MTYDEAMTQARELRTRFDAPFSTSDKRRIEELYEAVFLERMKPTSCQSCYHDALIRVYTYLKKEGKMREKCNYRLRAGFIMKCPLFMNGKIFTNYNLTDEVAEAYLAMFPKNSSLCERITPKYEAAQETNTITRKRRNSRRNERKDSQETEAED